MIHVRGLQKAYQDVSVLTEIDFDVKRGEFFGIIGPNGSGKSTLLKMISSVIAPDAGEITLADKPLARYTRKELARVLAVLEQEGLPPVGFRVREVLEMGRFPYQNWLGEEKDDVTPLIEEIMQLLGLVPLAERTLDQLSGGEKQRVALGKALVQKPQLLLLDEPTTYLDIGYQIQLMDIVRKWQKTTQVTVVAVLHDLNLASLYCDRILMLHKGVQIGVGTPQDMLQTDKIEAVYGTRPIVMEHPVHHLPQIMLQSRA
ncbi:MULTISPECIES: ABC transporter ATP-binding protein [Brevibacillus]|jgi:ABC-type cobalamin/Fe3+-siderophores transport systems, ATPase components|uniref:ABC transporter ATP-binding protein n=1 Tax=Brevibacillus TaxID=55080 RepID=UPI000ED79B34|nr:MULTISPECIES: ABC transporter ATP-binding protein [Brevibacillus]MBU8715464.1 ATP-binding cassette domain-containing protein [Brevibacillus parabrevis]MDH6349594.1 iron complex transport system ATP-binding protein [Brevibacillus sp. 1238]MDR4999050.1 ABC transporter ATP-binding protein [Brevibacillus parabrevis]MED2254397.1 ABC transporter ATP-binding protein [Brevibacillus parabrevis]NRQ54590.1 ABC transporter ATP-binding protein [Brevibacillus sp. HD1.4A]